MIGVHVVLVYRFQGADLVTDRSEKKNVTDARPNPHTKWVCGYQRLGLGCVEGPDEHGACCQLHKARARVQQIIVFAMNRVVVPRVVS